MPNLLPSCVALALALAAAANAAAPPAPARIGQIIIVGNVATGHVILEHVTLYPGQVLTHSVIEQAERKLARLGIFVKPPTITVLDNLKNPDSQFKDIRISGQEVKPGVLMFGVGVNSDSGLTGSLILNPPSRDE